jgi:predicted dehydrogenase
MLDRERFDVVAVCNSNGERAAAIRTCLERKIHVVAEKPLAIEMADLARVKEAVAASGVHLTMLLPMRFDPMYLALRQVVESGAIGEVAQITAQKSYRAGWRPEWYKRRATYGGTIPWIGIHMIDLMRWTSGREFAEAVSFQSSIGFPDLGEMENVTGSLFRLDNGGVATLHMDYLRPATAPTHGDDRLRLAGTKGVAEYQASTGVTLLAAAHPPRVISDLPPQRSLFIEFLESVYLGRPPSLTLADIYRVNEIALLARESAERRRPVKL